MNTSHKIKGPQFLLYSLFLGPFFPVLYFREAGYPLARVLAPVSIILTAACLYLLTTFTTSPLTVQIIYAISHTALVGLSFFYCWSRDTGDAAPTEREKRVLSISRAIAWMIVMGAAYHALNTLSQALYYWILGDRIAVYASARGNIFLFWIYIGFIHGFIYGLDTKNRYADRSFSAFTKTLGLILFFIVLYSGLILLFIIYPRQRLTPVSYIPQSMDFLFYALFFFSIVLSAIHLIRTAHGQSLPRVIATFVLGLLLISVHTVIASGYATTLTLTVASILEDRQETAGARKLYEKCIPYIRYDELLASLHHRQGVLQVLRGDYPAALGSFKRVLADYSKHYDVYERAEKYVESHERNMSRANGEKRVLSVKHSTFEQAASCFPNSLSVILNFYEENPVSTRKLSYAIKEDFSSGTFIWKAESFLAENGYGLVTTFWQNREMLISLLDAGFPVLLYVPGHVYTLYGYDARMEMFFTYDTAKSNRWNDKTYWELQKDWMQSGFLMSVVIPEQDLPAFMKQFPQLRDNREKYALWQKSLIGNYYEEKSDYRPDFDPHKISRAMGLDRLSVGSRSFVDAAVSPFKWDKQKWEQDIAPVLDQPWAMDWSRMEDFLLYLIHSGQTDPALALIEKYHPRITGDEDYHYARLLELKLAALGDSDNTPEVLSVSDKLIGISNGEDSRTYWGHLYKAGHLLDSGNVKGAVDLLLPVLKEIRLGNKRPSQSIIKIVGMLGRIEKLEPTLIDSKNGSRLKMAQTYLGLSN